jgi:para-aminobenzoate synthetase / 4-amino-4-deoxychorismate lyase
MRRDNVAPRSEETDLPIRALIRDADTETWLAFSNPVTILAANDPAGVSALLERVAAISAEQRLYAVGYLTYEAAGGIDRVLRTRVPGFLPPAWFALFHEPEIGSAPHAPARRSRIDWRPNVTADEYAGAIERVRAYIAAGDTYQVNYSYRLDAEAPGADTAWSRDLFAAMVARQAAGYGAWIDTDRWAICSASHELFFARRGATVTSRPMKGTVARGRTAAEDAMRANWLRRSRKNRAENLMITDMVRNDLGRVARVGSVRTEDLFRLEPYPTLWQLTSTVRAESDASLGAVMAALFPAASITGAPKRRTMEVIHELETRPREIYTGSIGLLRPDGSAQFSVAIRTALVDKHGGRAEYGVGGGVLWDSTADEEYRETQTKAGILGMEPTCAEPVELLETLLWRPVRGLWLLDAHLDRLGRSAAFFGTRYHRDVVREALDTAAQCLPPKPHRLRLRLDAQGTPTVETAPLGEGPPSRRVVLAACRLPLQDDPFVHHKTTRRDIYRRALEAAQAITPAADDVLLVNEHGEVTESTIANLLVEIDGAWFTPPVSSGLLPGVYRQWLIQRGAVSERVITPTMLARASALQLANSVRGRWPVSLTTPTH